jgi:GT2 family glycosyltransferase
VKIKLYIITYNNNNALNACLESLYNSIIPSDVVLEKYIINNHSNFSINQSINQSMI